MTAIASFTEKSDNPVLCNYILNTFNEWIFTPAGGCLTLKDKGILLSKFAVHESSNLFPDFLNLVAKIYADEKLSRSDLTVRLEPVFMIGTRYSDNVIREKFLNLMDRHLPKTLYNSFLH